MSFKFVLNVGPCMAHKKWCGVEAKSIDYQVNLIDDQLSIPKISIIDHSECNQK